MIDKQRFIDLASHAAGRPITGDESAKGYGNVAELQRELARTGHGERDFQNFIRFCQICCAGSSANEFEWQKQKVVGEWRYPRGVFCQLADNGRPFRKVPDELAALYGFPPRATRPIAPERAGSK